jgi:hypothetical protein
MSGNAPAKPKAPDKPTKTPTKSGGVAPVQIVGGTGATSSDSSGSKLKLPTAAQLVKAGVPEDVARLVAGKTIPINTYDGENPTGEELLDAIDSISTDTFPGIDKRVTPAEMDALHQGLSNYLGINPNGTESEQEDAADLAAAHIPATGAQAGWLSLAANAGSSSSGQNTEAEEQRVEEEYEIKEDTAETNYYKNAISGEIDAANSGATESAKYTALANADATLTAWGIDTPEMNNMVANLAAEGVTNPNEILDNIRQTATYKKAFAGLAEYNAQAGHIHMTETEYRTYSQSILGAAQQYGVPKDFINQDEIGTLLKGNVSASEFQQRVEDIYSAVSNADPGTKKLLQTQFGVGPGQLLAYFANPDKALPVLQRQVASAEIGDYAQRVGLSGLTLKGEEQLAQQAKLAGAQGNNQLSTGVSTIEGSLLSASKDAALLSSNPGAQKPLINTNELIGSQIAGFQGTSEVGAQTAVERAEQAKAAPFESGGGDVQTDKGVVGAGSART